MPDGGNGRPIPKPQASCTLEVAPGMKIKTQLTSPVADKAQHGMLEMLLINHPLDCPICDKGGECPLQNQALSHGYAETRFTDIKRTYPKPINISANVLLDRERCVLCARCTRFSEQIAGDPFIALIERGALQQVGIYEKEPFQSYFSGNTIQICPVGALTSAAYRFRSRPFDLVSTPVDRRARRLRIGHPGRPPARRRDAPAGRRRPRGQRGVDHRQGPVRHRYGLADDRLTRPLVREANSDGQSVLRPASWPEAIDVAVRGLQAAARPTGRSASGVLTGGRLTFEDAYAYAKFARVGARHQQHRLPGPAALRRGDRLPDARGGRDRALLRRPGVTYADLESASSVLLVCFEPEEEAGTVFLRLRKATRKRGLSCWTLAPFLSNGATKIGAQLIPRCPGPRPRSWTDWAPADWLALDAGGAADDHPRRHSVIIVGERAAGLSGTLSACQRLSERTGARLAWIPRRAGDRGALDAGCLPNLLPGGRPLADPAARIDTQTTWGVDSLPTLEGRDADEMLMSAADDELAALIVAGVDPNDFPDPQAVARRTGSRRLRDQPGDPGVAGHRARRRGVPGLP